VPSTTLWWVEDEQYLARIAIRHRLTAHLLEGGGHIGYDVRPSARRRGHATTMLRAALPVAHDMGIASALVTCDVTNVASRRVIEANGGVFEDQRGERLRFWVPTTQFQPATRTPTSGSAADRARWTRAACDPWDR
jgi:predicted acetyltransferase